MEQINVSDLLKKAEKRYLRRMNKYDWFKESEKPFKPAIKAYTKLNIFKASNVSFDPNKCEALSYGWWIFVARINGLIVFNNYRYSSSTSQHQSKVRDLLRDLGIKIDMEFEAPKGLQNLENAVFHYQQKVNSLALMIQKAGSRLEKNRERALEIKSHLNTIKNIKSLISKRK